MSKPVMEEQPGPPFNHNITGSCLGSLLDSKNQKKKCLSFSTSKYPDTYIHYEFATSKFCFSKKILLG